jgi:transposase
MLALSSSQVFILYVPPTDMRKGFYGLCGLINTQLDTDPTDGSVYIFVNKTRNKIKLLHWQSGGFILYYKRLEKGTIKIPTYDAAVLSIGLDYSGIVLLLDGVVITNINRASRYKKA